MLQLGELTKTRFKRVIKENTKNSTHRLDVCFFTNHNASMNVSLLKYNDGRCFLCTRGSPIKILTGQNILDVRDHKVLLSIRQKLTESGGSCSDFEAKSVMGFKLLGNCIKKELGISFYTEKELNDLDTLNISVYSLTFALEKPFGSSNKDRNENLHLLAYLATATVEFGNDRFPLTDYLKVNAKNWRMTDDDCEGFVGRNTGVLLSKTRSNSVLLKQLYYIKELEVDNKTYSGIVNKDIIESMDPARKNRMTRSIRVDNTFGKEYLKEWLKARNGREYSDITIRDANDLCDNETIILAMASEATNDLGARLLLLSPTIATIRNLLDSERLSALDKEILREWIHLPVSVEVKSGGSKKLVWDNICARSSSAKRLNERLIETECLDIRLPLKFYMSLNVSRGNFFYSGKEHQAVEADQLGYKQEGSFVDLLPDARKKVMEQVGTSLKTLRNTSVFLPPMSKKHSIKALT